MSNNRLVENAWVDIIPPDAPAYSNELLLLGAVLLTLLGAGVLYYIYTRPGQQAKRQLRRLSTLARQPQPNSKAVCFGLRNCLRTAYRCDDLQDVHFASAARQDWQSYLDKLSRFCFSRYSPSSEELTVAINEARAWLNKNVVAR